LQNQGQSRNQNKSGLNSATKNSPNESELKDIRCKRGENPSARARRIAALRA
jgi:hypothetical protein